MGEHSAISWTHSTFNPWWGCARVSPGCLNCYAESTDARWNADDPHWGKTAPRKMMSDAYWRKPLTWDRKAAESGERHRVFCASMADVFEDRDDLIEPRARLWRLIRDTPNLDWLLLTKRPENMQQMLPWTSPNGWAPGVTYSPWPNVWLGITVEDQQRADERIPVLLDTPAAVRFLSCEPLLGAVDLGRMHVGGPCDCGQPDNGVGIEHEPHCGYIEPLNDYGGMAPWPTIDWVICGGESGGKHTRPMHPTWARTLRDQCQAAGVPFHFKQWGSWGASDGGTDDLWMDSAGRERGPSPHALPLRYAGVSGKSAGRELDGRTWDEYPAARERLVSRAAASAAAELLTDATDSADHALNYPDSVLAADDEDAPDPQEVLR